MSAQQQQQQQQAAGDASGDRSQLMSFLEAENELEDIDGDDIMTEVSITPETRSLERQSFVAAVDKEPREPGTITVSKTSLPVWSDDNNKREGEETGDGCGWWSCRPAWLQRLNQFELFLVLLAVSGICTGLQGAFKSALLTKLEKRFNFDSKTSSLIVTANDMVFLPSVMLVSYFGSLGHRPRLLSLSCFGYGFAALLFAVPYFIFGPQAPIREPADIRRQLGYNCSPGANGSALANASLGDAVGDGAGDTGLESMVALGFFMLSGFIEGLSAAPYWNLGVAFVDDVTGDLSGVFIGLIIAARILSPSIGYQLYGKVLVRINEDLTPASPQQLSHPRYVPAWWFGFVLVGLIAIVVSIPMSLFPSFPHFNDKKYRPKRRRSKNPDADDDEEDNDGLCCRLFHKLHRKTSEVNQRKRANMNARVSVTPANEKGSMSFGGFFAAVKRLLSNPVYVSLLCGNLFEFMEINCVIAYMAKYLELHFRIPSGDASMLTGIAVPGANTIGILISSFIASQVNWRVPQLAKYHACVNCFGILAAATGFFFACPSVEFVGGLHREGSSFATACSNITDLSPLASSCNCSSSIFKPTCINGSNYFNPCSGNCYVSRGSVICGCSGDTTFPISQMRHRTNRLCSDECSTLAYTFVAIFVVIKLVRLSARSQEAVLQMRCVRPKDKALGLGINSFCFSLGGIWVPTFVGFLFDQACIFHDPLAGGGGNPKKSCLFYDATKFRFSFVGFTSAALLPACSFFFLAWYFTDRNPKYVDMSSRRGTVELASNLVRTPSENIT